MAATHTLTLSPIYTPKPRTPGIYYYYYYYPLRQAHLNCHVSTSNAFPPPLILNKSRKRRAVMSSASNEDQTLFTQPPPDLFTMFFQVEGTMNEAVIPTVTSALQGMESISNLKVQVVEGIASVELMKETTQATGVASSLVEVIQASGFKLHTLNLSFEDHEEVLLP